MSIRIILLDLDGTLLTRDKRLSPGNRRALERAAAAGIWVVPATGRFYQGMPAVVRELPFVRYAVTVNGAQVYDAAEDAVLHRAEIPLPAAERVFQRAAGLPAICDCYLDGWGYMDAAHYAQIDQFITDPQANRMVKELRRPVADLGAFLRRKGRPLQKIQLFFREADRRRAAMAELERAFPDMAVTSSIPNNIEINAAAATKGAALGFLCRHLGVDPRDTMACGDGSNDLSMLRAAGVGVAMANAEAAVKAAADFVTGDNDGDGVAQAIERFCLS